MGAEAHLRELRRTRTILVAPWLVNGPFRPGVRLWTVSSTTGDGRNVPTTQRVHANPITMTALTGAEARKIHQPRPSHGNHELSQSGTSGASLHLVVPASVASLFFFLSLRPFASGTLLTLGPTPRAPDRHGARCRAARGVAEVLDSSLFSSASVSPGTACRHRLDVFVGKPGIAGLSSFAPLLVACLN